MRYWWVNQNQTYRYEVSGGYLWSPKRNANGARNPFYESMREVSPGDVIFSFSDTRIAAIGIAQSYCWESPKPLEFVRHDIRVDDIRGNRAVLSAGPRVGTVVVTVGSAELWGIEYGDIEED